MPSLHELQRAFARAMVSEHDAAAYGAIDGDGVAPAERLRIYRNTFRSTLTRTLRMVYPAVDRLVGTDFFDRAAEAFVAAHPPESGDLNEYGEGFADFLAGLPPAVSVPYLADVARFEWALNVAANVADAPVLDANELASLDSEQHASLRFAPHPSVSLLALAYPADHIADAVLSADDEAMAQVDLSSGPVLLVIHRGAQGVEAQRLAPDAHRFLSVLYAGEVLGALLDTAAANAPMLLAEELVKGRLTAFERSGRSDTMEPIDERG